jgi:hypothetical protein
MIDVINRAEDEFPSLPLLLQEFFRWLELRSPAAASQSTAPAPQNAFARRMRGCLFNACSG